MRYSISIRKSSPTRLDIDFIPENLNLSACFAQVRLVNYPKFILHVSNSEYYNEELVQIMNAKTMDLEDKIWAKNFKESEISDNEMYIVHDVMGKTIIEEFIFDKILYDFGSKLLEIYGVDIQMQDSYVTYWNWWRPNGEWLQENPVWKDAMEESLKQLKSKILSNGIEIEQNIVNNKKHTSYTFFDGLKIHSVINQYNDWLSSTDYSVWSNSYVEVGNKRINIIKENVKTLSTFSHFNKEKLELLAKQHELEIKEENGVYYAYTPNHNSRQLEISENNDLIVIYSIDGGRAPESIFIYGVFEK
jgi:hypothetical protein